MEGGLSFVYERGDSVFLGFRYKVVSVLDEPIFVFFSFFKVEDTSVDDFG